MATILVTGAGGPCGIGAITALKAETTHRVVGVDMDPTAAGLHLADDSTSVPAANDETWPEALAAVIAEFDVDVLIPTVDEELAALPSLSRTLHEDVPIVAPTRDVIELSLDKYHTMNRLSAAGHHTPRTWLATEADQIDPTAFPLVVKPRKGRGSRGVQHVTDREALASHIADAEYEPEALLCQERIAGTEYTTSVVGTQSNRLLSVVPKEAIEKDGSTVLGATRRAPAVATACAEIFQTLAPAGPLNVQQIVDRDGVPYTIEINPRFSSTSCLTVAAGVDEFDLLIRDALGEQVDSPAGFETDRYILRYQSHLFADSEQMAATGAGSVDSRSLETQ